MWLWLYVYFISIKVVNISIVVYIYSVSTNFLPGALQSRLLDFWTLVQREEWGPSENGEETAGAFF